jgi:hypothetical protein
VIDLDAINARCKAATSLPWTSQPYDDLWEVTPVAGGQDYGVFEEADAEFVAHAREDIPALIAEVERLRLILGRELVGIAAL